MNITLKDLKACEKGLTKILTAELPAVSSFRLLGTLDIVRKSLERLEEVRKQLVVKYGEKNDSTGVYTVPRNNEKWDQFLQELGDVLAEEVTIEGFIPLDINQLGNTTISTVELEPLLGKFLVDESKPVAS